MQDGCCQKVNCITCPDDSYPTFYKDDAVEDKCVCYPCSGYECESGKKAVVKQKGKGGLFILICF